MISDRDYMLEPLLH